uniref:Putative secreted protein n=1 Tax=Anopheles darlingi TaxID=43151 RepID=A0A2M4D0F7_ANODA
MSIPIIYLQLQWLNLRATSLAICHRLLAIQTQTILTKALLLPPPNPTSHRLACSNFHQISTRPTCHPRIVPLDRTTL